MPRARLRAGRLCEAVVTRNHEQNLSCVMQPNSRIVLLVCDPTALYVYWELDLSLRRRIAAGAAPGLVVRLHDIDAERDRGGAEAVYLDYDFGGQQNDGVLAQVQPDRSYEAELGYSPDEGEWCSVARSNRAQSPPRAPSDWAEDHFVTVPWDADLSAFTSPESLLLRERVAVDVAPGWTRQASSQVRLTEPRFPRPTEDISEEQAEDISEEQAEGQQEEQAEGQQAVQSWPGNARVRRAALPLAGAEPVAGPPVETPPGGPLAAMPVAVVSSDGPTGESQRSTGVHLSATAGEQTQMGGGPPAPAAEQAVSAPMLREVEPLPRYGVVAPGGSPTLSYRSSPSSAAVGSSGQGVAVPAAQPSAEPRLLDVPDRRGGSGE